MVPGFGVVDESGGCVLRSQRWWLLGRSCSLWVLHLLPEGMGGKQCPVWDVSLVMQLAFLCSWLVKMSLRAGSVIPITRLAVLNTRQVQYHLLCLCGYEVQVIVGAPLGQIAELPPCRLSRCLISARLWWCHQQIWQWHWKGGWGSSHHYDIYMNQSFSH